jgi:DNA repair exonuclease SbcCD ATPase subunit
MSEGPVILSDVGMTFTRGQIRDLDLIGRENAEKSNDIKLALMKGWVKELRKDPRSSSSGLDPKVVQDMQDATAKTNQVAAKLEQVAADQKQAIGKLEESNKRLEEELKAQKEQNAAVLSNTERLMVKMQEMIDQDPLRMKAIKEALENIQVERADIASQRDALSGDSETEIKASEKILQMRDKKLQKNYEGLGKTIIQTPDSIQDALDAMDTLGI